MAISSSRFELWRRTVSMSRHQHGAVVLCLFALCLSKVYVAAAEQAGSIGILVGQQTATGKRITPEAAAGAIFAELDPHLPSAPERRPGGASALAVSPDGKRLAILTSGFNAYWNKNGDLVPEASMEYVFLFDITKKAPRQIQVLPVANTFPGMAWSPKGALYVSGGKDDSVVEFVEEGGELVHGRTFQLHHNGCLSAKSSPSCGPVAAGIAVSPDGRDLLVANIQNDSVSLIDLDAGKVVAEQDLRPGKIDARHHGVPGGSYPRAVVWASDQRAYVAGVRDREVIALGMEGQRIHVRNRFPVHAQPAALISNRGGTRLYVALDTASQVAVYDTTDDSFIERFNVVAPPNVYDDSRLLGGANTNALALTPNERMLLVSNGGFNSVAVVNLAPHAIGGDETLSGAHSRSRDKNKREDNEHSVVVGLVPTGWYPTGVTTAHDGATWYVVNQKSPVGPNGDWCRQSNAGNCDLSVVAKSQAAYISAPNGVAHLAAKNLYISQLEHSGFLTMPAPSPIELARLTKQVAQNDRFDKPDRSAVDEQTFAFLRHHIKHVIYIMKENRSYDQILGDLEVGNGEPRLAVFPEPISPNHHSIARNFVTLDNLRASGEGSINGEYWTFAAQTNDLLEHTDTQGLAIGAKGEAGGFPYGSNRQDNIGYPMAAQRHEVDKSVSDDPDILPGTRSVYDVDGPGNEAGAGYLWNAAIQRGLSVRDYGVFSRMFYVPVPRRKFPDGNDRNNPGLQALASNADLNWPDLSIHWSPDSVRVREWKREFDGFVARGAAPNLMVMFLYFDHLGNFANSSHGVNTPETQMADNDYAVGTVVEAVAKSPFAKDTLVVTIEDDTTDGPDHVDAERTVALFAGPYVRQHAVVSTPYTTVNVVKTIEEVLGIGPIGWNDALAAPMSDVFDVSHSQWSYKAIVPDVLRSTKLPLPPDAHAHVAYPKHSAAYWEKAMAGQDFSSLDQIKPDSFNRALWRGLKGNTSYPALNRSPRRDGDETR